MCSRNVRLASTAVAPSRWRALNSGVSAVNMRPTSITRAPSFFNAATFKLMMIASLFAVRTATPIRSRPPPAGVCAGGSSCAYIEAAAHALIKRSRGIRLSIGDKTLVLYVGLHFDGHEKGAVDRDACDTMDCMVRETVLSLLTVATAIA